VNAHRSRCRREELARLQDIDPALRVLQIDKSWYYSYWYDEPKPVRASRVAGGVVELSAFARALLGPLGRLRWQGGRPVRLQPVDRPQRDTHPVR
jgi:hypothetical protein